MKYNKYKIPNISKEDIENFNNDMRYVYVAHDKLLKKLLGFVPENPSDYLLDLIKHFKVYPSEYETHKFQEYKYPK